MAGPVGSTSAGGFSRTCRGAEEELGSLRSGVSPTSTAPWLVDEELCGGCCASSADGSAKAMALEISPANRGETMVRCDIRNNIDMVGSFFSLCSAEARVKRAADCEVSRERRHQQS